MERFCIIVNSEKDHNHKTALYIMDYLKKKDKSCFLAASITNSGSADRINEIPEETECAIVLGGDGTIIQAANDLVHRDIPILGVNLGTVGYLAEIEKQNIVTALEKLFADDCQIEKRLMLNGEVFSGNKNAEGEGILNLHKGCALNDIFVTKSSVCRLVEIKLYINEKLIDTYVGDGVIISTPTGSTGYNLSAGGPVLEPGINALVITPICPHSLNKRSLVVSDVDKIRMEIGRCKERHPDEAVVYFDGNEISPLVTGDFISITRAKENTQIIKLTENSFFDILKNKLGREKV
ncbi:NAD(+)/NADH kinase [Anaeromicropila populeti]|uniref:NAD kinase n=1 Tax=Anaeromicropila populeti TaxID=37658 RepID=A0A1I6ILA7_9FIRM|nr:NAD(+)/NADH kinase [Anaeromicropila populeti]SFR67451.1 NAD+ kinase [Anaeromicropila populeti]